LRIDKEKKNLLVFGYGLALILSVIAVNLWWEHGLRWTHAVLLSGIVTVILLTAFRRDLLKRFYARWMRVAHVIGAVVTGVILSLVFYAVFVPVGIVLRLLRKDFLDRGFDDRVRSYWLKRKHEDFSLERYTQQF
jgi:hypothetical protein